MMIRGFESIALSLKALRKALRVQLEHSKNNFMFAWDRDLSREFIKSIEETLKLMERLFGDSIEDTLMYCVLEGGEID